jgi:hypothetical protein
MSEITKLFLYRMQDGVKTPVEIGIDANKVIVYEREVEDAVRDASGHTLGVTTEMRDGKKVITHVSNATATAMRFFSTESPCWFEGCEELRAKYAQELESIGGDACPACKRGALTRKYLPMVIAKLQ